MKNKTVPKVPKLGALAGIDRGQAVDVVEGVEAADQGRDLTYTSRTSNSKWKK